MIRRLLSTVAHDNPGIFYVGSNRVNGNTPQFEGIILKPKDNGPIIKPDDSWPLLGLFPGVYGYAWNPPAPPPPPPPRPGPTQ